MKPSKNKIEQYVRSCINPDGGYSFTKGVDSNAQDTYFATATLIVLGLDIRKKQETAAWLHSYPVNDIRSLYYITLSLAMLGEDSPERDHKLLAAFRLTHDSHYVGLSEFESIFMYACLSNILDMHEKMERVIQYLLKFRNWDGGFGRNNNSNLVATYHAVSELCSLGFDVDRLDSTKDFVRACERTEGGFDLVPKAHASYLECTYAGVELLDLFLLEPRYPELSIRSIAESFRLNGGFARGDIGIPTLESTFYAASCLTKLGYFSATIG